MKHILCPAFVVLLVIHCVQAAEVPFFRIKGDADGIGMIRFSPDGKKVITTDWFVIRDEDNRIVQSGFKTVRIWDVESGKELHNFGGCTLGVYAIVFSPDGKKIVATRNERDVRIWDTETGQELQRLVGHTAYIPVAAISSDGKQIITVSADRTTRMWDAESGKELQTLVRHTDFAPIPAISPDGSVIAMRGLLDTTVRVWRDSGNKVQQLEGVTEHVHSIRLSPDGKRIAAANGRTARIWDIESGKELHRFEHAD